jgi:hypothetical protein
MTRKLDRLNPSNSSGVAFQRLWQRNCEAVEQNFDSQQSQLDSINAILDPNTLTPDKKPIWMFMQAYLTGEQSDIDSKATTYGVTTEKTNYDNAISALTSYLATLTTPVAWNNTSGNTTIVDTTFRSKFTDVLTTKQVLLDKMHDSAKTLADSAQAGAEEYVADIPDVIITADHSGTVTPSSQLSKIINCKRYNDTTSVTTSATWSRTVISGGITCTMASTTGALTISALTSDAVVEVSSVRTVSGQSITLTKRFNVYLVKAAAPVEATSGGSATGTGGTTATDSSFASFNSTSMATVSDTLTVTAGTNGQADLSAPLGVTTGAASPASAALKVYGIWQWDQGTGTWADLGTEVASSPDCSVEHDSETGEYYPVDGALSVSYSKTGLTNGSSYSFRLRARNNSGTRVMYLSGVASAVGS